MGKFFKTAQTLNKNLVHYSGGKPELPRGPKPDPNLLTLTVDPNQTVTSHFASSEPILPSGPTNPDPSIVIDPDTMLASVPGHTPDDRKDMNYWFADYAVRQSKGIHNPYLRPVARARQKLKDKGFKIHTTCIGKDCKPAQTNWKTDPDAVAAASYNKKLQKIIKSPSSRQAYLGNV